MSRRPANRSFVVGKRAGPVVGQRQEVGGNEAEAKEEAHEQRSQESSVDRVG